MNGMLRWTMRRLRLQHSGIPDFPRAVTSKSILTVGVNAVYLRAIKEPGGIFECRTNIIWQAVRRDFSIETVFRISTYIVVQI